MVRDQPAGAGPGIQLRLLDNRVQLNGDVYRVDWKDPQYTTPMPNCGLVTTFNVPSARSQGRRGRSARR